MDTRLRNLPSKISIHSLVKRETHYRHFLSHDNFDFNPLPRKEGDRFEFFVKLKFCISIHSLVKRETTFSYCLKKAWAISIHSLVKRETAIYNGTHDFSSRISIHSLVKRETSPSSPCVHSAHISIHSLVKRETLPWFTPPPDWQFQSTPS